MSDTINDAPDTRTVKKYMRTYFAMEDLLSAGVALYDLLAKRSPKREDREQFSALEEDANNKLDLLNAKLDGYLEDPSSILAPTPAEVDTAQKLSKDLAELRAKEVMTEETAKLISDALTSFNNTSDAGAAGA